jgi:hypothetical protein
VAHKTRDDEKLVEIMDSRSKTQARKKFQASKQKFIPLPKLFPNVSIKFPLLGMVLKLKYVDFNIQDEENFSELHFELYAKVIK